jgi:hypothetical protein
MNPLAYLSPPPRRTLGGLTTMTDFWLVAGVVVAGAIVWDVHRGKSWTR